MEKMEVFWLDFCIVEGLLWISINSQSYKWGATLDLVKIEILESRGYFGLGGGLLWQGATLDRSSLTVQTVSFFKSYTVISNEQQRCCSESEKTGSLSIP